MAHIGKISEFEEKKCLCSVRYNKLVDVISKEENQTTVEFLICKETIMSADF